MKFLHVLALAAGMIVLGMLFSLSFNFDSDTDPLVDLLLSSESKTVSLPEADFIKAPELGLDIVGYQNEWRVDIVSSVEVGGKLFLITQASHTNQVFSARAFGALIGLHVLRMEKGEYEIEYSNFTIDYMGSSGYLGDAAVRPILLSENVVGFVFTSGFLGQGHYEASKIVHAYYDDESRKLLDIKNARSNNLGVMLDEFDSDFYEKDTVIQTIKGANSLYDLRVITLTSNYNVDQFVSTEAEVEMLEFREGAYRSVID